ncbi:S26 family signal peptidase [Halomicroarcula sp. GCM10025324]|uniref:S26 family signal peptidase n=1 Tax=Haloarcula TaxID=2237 RepID=UPI0023E8861F|nr:S26 family signal peptidase [Halomicroarcula sp. ZS-22-S1]
MDDEGRTAERDDRAGGAVGHLVTDVGNAVVAVALVGLFLFAVSGVWPPLVAIESPSMTPNIETGDMVFVMEPERFAGPDARHGVVTAAAGDATGYVAFGRSGDVIVFRPDGDRQATPIIHRAMLWVDVGENWYDRADPNAVGTAGDCDALRNCPAPHSGFVTQGDFNTEYDQVGTTSTVVRPSWVVGTGEVRLPGLGWLRLRSQVVTGGQPTAGETAESTASGSVNHTVAGRTAES